MLLYFSHFKSEVHFYRATKLHFLRETEHALRRVIDVTRIKKLLPQRLDSQHNSAPLPLSSSTSFLVPQVSLPKKNKAPYTTPHSSPRQIVTNVLPLLER
mmetsp:Transcript_15443/g.19290  ORF Transcript_15443/g.19290 Transcript_15443/m.19290 type:complete len:100 (+) Transcript_15443:273-572(+)